MAQAVLLKKYANRRLYDTERSVYITLGQVAEMIKAGRQVQVIDAKTEEDVTAFILTQIIVEEAKNRNSLLPVSLLHLIIEHGEKVLSEFFDKYLELTIKSYLGYRAAVDEQFRKWLDLGGDLSSLAQKNLTSFPGFPSFADLFGDGSGKSREPADEP